MVARTHSCALCLRVIRPGDSYTVGLWNQRVYCGESCKVADDHRRGRAVHYVPNPQYHRTGDGWRGVRRWVNAKVHAPK